MIEIHVQRLPEGVYLATSRHVPGLTVETATREEAEALAAEVAIDLLEEERGGPLLERPPIRFTFD